MQDSTSREKVLKNIRTALINSMHAPFPPQEQEEPVLKPLEDEDALDVAFAVALNEVSGHFVYTAGLNELNEAIITLIEQKGYKKVFCLIPQIKDFLEKNNIAITDNVKSVHECDLVISDCECLIARFGSVVLSSAQVLSRKGIAAPENHIVIARNNQIVRDIKDAFAYLKKKYDNVLPSMFTMVTGPSRTADIEKTLVLGAHGQKELFVFLLG